MKKIIVSLSILMLQTWTLHAEEYPVKVEESIEENFKFEDAVEQKNLNINNVFGGITVTGYSENTVELQAIKTIYAVFKGKLQEAKEDVALEISSIANTLDLYVDGPFRREDSTICFDSNYGYRVHYDFKLKIPKDVNLCLKTIGWGDITVSYVSGNFKVENINGGVMMNHISGSGKAYALNKDVKIIFTKNPKQKSYFGSLNGDVRLYLQSPLSAQFSLKTFNGDIYSEFEFTHTPSEPYHAVEINERNVYKTGHPYIVQMGKGGPLIEYDGFNGDLFILKNN